jgi:hypothetical protein
MIINDNSNKIRIVVNGNGTTFKNLAVIGIPDITSCKPIDPIIVPKINGLVFNGVLNNERFSLRQFRTLIF